MSKILSKLNLSQDSKNIINSAKFKVATFVTTSAIALQSAAYAVDPVAGADPISSMTATFSSVSTICLNGVAAIAPVAVTIFGCMFAWKKGIHFFKDLTKA